MIHPCRTAVGAQHAPSAHHAFKRKVGRLKRCICEGPSAAPLRGTLAYNHGVANEDINGVSISLEEYGSGDPLVLVHGSWTDHMEWPFIVPGLAQRFRVVVYDRRGHSQSERLPTQGSVHEDVADLAAIIERAGAPAHVLGNSMGASISLRLAAARPELLRTLSVHEPPLFDILRDDPKTNPLAEELDARILPVINDLAAGNMEDGARRFIEMILGDGAWDNFIPDEAKRTLL